VDIKVVIIGSPYIYHLLYAYDEEFKALFKVKSEFDLTMKKNSGRLQQYAKFIAAKCKEENLMPFTRNAVAKIIEYSSRLSEHQKKMTARFLDIIDIMNESDYWAKKDSSKLVTEKHVREALEKKLLRSNLIEMKMQDLVEEKTILIDVEGEKIGQINGLSILDIGDYSFGKPSRITVETYKGKGNIIDIQRETKMSGSIHSKGVLILSSYIGDKFGKDKHLSFTASICFEQLYGEIDGDSASSTELYCLLSSLSGLPLRQDIAVTGSVNQKGTVQPVGGINEKIEGFYQACKISGLTRKQGVMMPSSNIKNLMLNDEVIDAVEAGKFHIYPVSTIKEGIEILTGIKAGNRLKKGGYSRDSVFDLVDN
ncbi:Lon-insertion domain-containing protein, partial [Elusimicrobiota bacterium]